MVPKNTLNEPPEGQGQINVPPLCSPSERIDFDDIPLYFDILGLPEEGEEGTRIFKQLDAPSTERMARWLRDNGVPNPVQTSEFHVSLFEHSKLFPWDGTQAMPITVQPDEMYLERFEKGGKQMLNLVLRSAELWARRETIEKSLKEHSLKADWRMKIGHDVAGWRPSARLCPIYFPLVLRLNALTGTQLLNREAHSSSSTPGEGEPDLTVWLALKIDTDGLSRRIAAVADRAPERLNWARKRAYSEGAESAPSSRSRKALGRAFASKKTCLFARKQKTKLDASRKC